MKLLKNKPQIGYLISLLCLLGLFALTFGTATGSDIEGEFINSDTLYLPSLYWDLFENGNHISEWNLNPAPNFFPDMLFYFILMKLTGNLLVSSFLFSLFQILFMNLLFTSLFKKITIDYYRLMIIANALLAFFALTELISDRYLFVFYFLSNSYHLGSFILTLISLNCILNYRKTGKNWNIAVLFLLCILGVMSDKLFLVGLTFPVFGIYLFFVLPKYKLKRDWIVFSIVSLASVGGILLLRVLTHNKVITIDDAHSFLNLENIWPSLLLLLEHYKIYLSEFNMVSLIMLTSLLSFILLTLYCIKLIRSKVSSTEQEQLAMIFCWSTISFVLISPVVAGNYTGFDTIRYNYHSYIFLILLLPFLVIRLSNLSELNQKILTRTSLISLVLLFAGFSIFSKPDFSAYFNLYPKKAEIADVFSRKTGLKTGTGGYWDAKLITLFSKENVVVLPAFSNLGFYAHATNRNWCHYRPGGNRKKVIVDFAIIDPIDSTAVLNIFEPNTTNYSTLKSLTFVEHPRYIYLDEMQFKVIHDPKNQNKIR